MNGSHLPNATSNGVHSPTLLRTALAIGLPLATVTSIVLALSYVNDQQNIRMAANEPQEWMANDVASRIEAGKPIQSDFIAGSVNVLYNHTPYIIVYDKFGSTTISSGVFEGKVSTLPRGLLESTRKLGINRVTWEPYKGVRQAIVLVPIHGGEGGYVLAGRSLAYAQEQESLLAKRALLGRLVAMLAIIIVTLLGALCLRKKNQ